jgi:hypothetical protein
MYENVRPSTANGIIHICNDMKELSCFLDTSFGMANPGITGIKLRLRARFGSDVTKYLSAEGQK